ncbi:MULTISPECIES: endonuclease/exonuclease/phosphatase family protein [Frankia]|uniref:Endonuclease/exonuclease/phosphatase domain-containing protein n=1 Tax=Frankia alni (strain DSM 45986 / CECT 9034 / ACN14a) TaxID=326424 RepID=Q0RM73_FRAAA|nr:MULTISPECIES: endonuclease/exonuclease/phosphatase family protein [Frankia]CAJ61379.1 hypothetical protein; putative DNase I-like domain [Frankia alni ACN14a]
MILKIIAQNLANGALATGDGDPEDRWPDLLARIAPHRPDLLLLCEASDWHRYGHKQLARAMRDLDMDACPLPPSSTGIRPAVMYRGATIGRWVRYNDDWSQTTVHGFGVAAFDIGLRKPLSVVAAHFDPHSPDKALQEAKVVATRGYKYGPLALVGGDINYPPTRGPAPAYGRMRPYNRAARTLVGPDGTLQPDTRVAGMLERCGYQDAALEMFDRSGDETLLRPTGATDRIDQIWVTTPLAPAVIGYTVLDTPEGASDHHGVMVELDTDLIDASDLWDYR